MPPSSPRSTVTSIYPSRAHNRSPPNAPSLMTTPNGSPLLSGRAPRLGSYRSRLAIIGLLLVGIYLFVAGPTLTFLGSGGLSALQHKGWEKDFPHMHMSDEPYCARTAGRERGAALIEELSKEEQSVVIMEHGIHDEVVGALIYSLRETGINPYLNWFARFKFPDILAAIAPGTESTLVNPHGGKAVAATEEMLRSGKVKVLMLTTCTVSLKGILPILLETKIHLVCFAHHAGSSIYHDLRVPLLQLAQEDRVTMIVLGDHVRREVRKNLMEWSEKFDEPAWERLPIETFLPIFDYPGDIPRENPARWPQRAAVQGNMEPHRRDYPKLFLGLVTLIGANPDVWGYLPVGEKGSAYMPDPDPSAAPFTLHLIGQPPPKGALEIPPELANVVHIHEKLSYPDYYALMTSMDMVIPAFAQGSTYSDTTSSSIAAGVITRVPILSSPRHVLAYNYLDYPAIVTRNISTSEMRSVENFRRQPASKFHRASGEAWRAYQHRIDMENVCMWQRVFGSMQ